MDLLASLGLPSFDDPEIDRPSAWQLKFGKGAPKPITSAIVPTTSSPIPSRGGAKQAALTPSPEAMRGTSPLHQSVQLSASGVDLRKWIKNVQQKADKDAEEAAAAVVVSPDQGSSLNKRSR